MTVLEGVLQGVIQGVTEFLPISSDGHLSLFQHFFGLSGENALFFTAMLHAGTLAAVFIAFWGRIRSLISEAFSLVWDLLRGRFEAEGRQEDRRAVVMILLTLVPLALFYFAKDPFTLLAEDSDIIVEGLGFLFTGLLLFLADRSVKGSKTARDMRPRDALWLGFFEGVAALPGVSRSGSTISVGLLRGFSKDFMVEFSFIMGIPAILGVCAVEVIEAVRSGMAVELLPMAAGMATSAIVGLGAIKLVKWLVVTDRYVVFAYYTLALGALTVAVGVAELFM